MLTKDVDKKLFLLDAFALIYRSYFAFSKNPRITSKGLNTSAVFGFLNTLMQVLQTEKPSHIAVVFDTEEPTHRHTEFEAYKAHRDEIPDDILKSLPYIDQLIEAMNIAAIRIPGYEADDIIGTLAKKAEKEGFEVYMMTPDKDFGQLVDEHIHIYKPARMGDGAEILGVNEILQKWEIRNVHQVIDILGLMGDASDNIPGIPGVGEKTAKQLIKEFGSLDKVLQNTSSLKGKLREKVENGRELALQSKRLATIITDIPLDFSIENLKVKEFNKDKLLELFKELEFRQFAQRLLGQTIVVPVSNKNSAQGSLFDETNVESNHYSEGKKWKTLEDVKFQYTWLKSTEDFHLWVKKIKEKGFFSFDTETTSLDVFRAKLVSVSFSTAPQTAAFVYFNHDKEISDFLLTFKDIFNDENITMIGQNLKYDLHVLKNYGIDVRCKIMDTMVEHFILKPDARHGMNELSRTYLNYDPIAIESLIGEKGKNQGNMKDVPPEKIFHYAAEDADITLQLHNIFAEKLKNEGMWPLMEEMEGPLVNVLLSMEREGFKLDVNHLKELEDSLRQDLIETEEEIYRLCGTRFNIASPKQVGELLFDVLKISADAKKTKKTGQYATGEDVLMKLRHAHPVVDKILLYREYQKLLSTYVTALPQMINPSTGKVHTTFNQVVAVTGRLSSDHPNLQNIPVRTERGRQIRKAFIPRSEDYVLLSADYSQIELRIVASISGDEAMCEAFRTNKDIHTATAARVYNIPENEVTKEMRYKAKSVNFGIIYGQGAFGLAENLGISRTEAKELIDTYFRQYPGIRKYMDDQIHYARSHGYVKTLLGRRRYLPDIHSQNQAVRGFAERNAINTPIQGTAADMIKKAMVNIHQKMISANMKSALILQVHDELVFDAHKNELDELQHLVKHEMENAIRLNVPVVVEMGTGHNWLEAH